MLSPLSKAEKLRDKILKYSAHARKFHIGLNGVNMANDMSAWMETCAATAETLFQAVANLTQAKANSEADYHEVTKSAQLLFDVYDQYAPLANQMLQGTRSKKEKKKKDVGGDGAANAHTGDEGDMAAASSEQQVAKRQKKWRGFSYLGVTQ